VRRFSFLVMPQDAIPELADLLPAERKSIWRQAHKKATGRWPAWIAYGGGGLSAVLGQHFIGGVGGAMVGGGIGGALAGMAVNQMVRSDVRKILAARRRRGLLNNS
jgi:hypothetical protein